MDNQATKQPDSPSANSLAPFWTRFAGLAALGAVLMLVAIAGGSTIYCRSFFGTIFWTLILGLVDPVMELTHEPGTVLLPLAAYLLTVFVVARFTRFRPTLLSFAIAVLLIYALSAAIDWALGWTGGVCTL
ncbi:MULTISPECIES: hypothetical protein [Burkholderiaceae]|uniref:hypothetical protein n=1 Tax=Burkholderiaceae TaxID=119060 RepID=UPI00115FBC6B|nr:hypothetical protein [Burkholderia sp. WP9]